MDLRRLVSFRFNWVLVFVLSVLTPVVNSHIQGCSIEGIHLEQCLNQDNTSFSIDKCCKALNQVVQAGYYCLCLLLSSSIPLLSSPFSLPLSDCFISTPPLTLCGVLAPMPVVLPPNSSEELTQPSASPKDVILPPPPHGMQVPPNSSQENDSTTVAPRQPDWTENAAPKFNVSKNGNETSNGKDKSKILLPQCLFLFLAVLHGCI